MTWGEVKFRHRRVVAAVAAATLVSGAALAWFVPSVGAHGGTSDEYRSKVTSIDPPDLPIEAKVKDGDDQLQIRNVGDLELIIGGYKQDDFDDPYVRIGPAGVFVNTKSAAYYQNQGRYGAPIPKGVGEAEAQPKWKRIREKPPLYSFHDHRIHWMLKGAPPNVEAESDKAQKVFDWAVPVRYGDRTGTIKGRLTYVRGGDGGSSLELWLTAAAVGFLVGVFVLDWVRRRRGAFARPTGSGDAERG